MKRLTAILVLALALAVHPVSAQQAERVVHQPAEGRPFSAAVQVGDMHWLSGKLGVTEETRAMTSGRAAAETHNIMRQFETLLGELGMDFGNVVRGVVYLADLDRHPENPWALHGLAECLRRRGDAGEANLVGARFEDAAARTDVEIRASCYCRLKVE